MPLTRDGPLWTPLLETCDTARVVWDLSANDPFFFSERMNWSPDQLAQVTVPGTGLVGIVIAMLCGTDINRTI